MAADPLFALDRLVVGATTIKGITTLSVDPGIERTLQAGGSELDPSLLASTGVKPLVRFATVDVNAALVAMFPSGTQNAPFIALNGAGPGEAYWKKLDHGGGQGAANKNIKNVINRGLVVPDRISNAGGVAVLECTIWAAFDGTTIPVDFVKDVSLPAGSSGAPTIWSLRAVKDNTTVLSQLRDIALEFGITVEREDPSNSIYSTGVAITGFRPRASFGTADINTVLGLATAFVGATAGAAGLQIQIAQFDGSAGLVKTSGVLALAMLGVTATAGGSIWYPKGFNIGPETAILECEAIGIGGKLETEPPLSLLTAQTLAAESSSPNRFIGGPAFDNTTEIDVRSGRMDFGLSWSVQGPATRIWDTQAVLMTRRREISINTSDSEFYRVLAATHGRDVATSFRIHLRAVNQQGEPIASATASHLRLAFTAGRIIPNENAGSDGQTITPGLVMVPTGGTLTISTAAAA